MPTHAHKYGACKMFVLISQMIWTHPKNWGTPFCRFKITNTEGAKIVSGLDHFFSSLTNCIFFIIILIIWFFLQSIMWNRRSRALWGSPSFLVYFQNITHSLQFKTDNLISPNEKLPFFLVVLFIFFALPFKRFWHPQNYT